MKNWKFQRVLLLLSMLCGLLLAACAGDDAAVSVPTAENQTENTGVTVGSDSAEETVSEPLFTGPETPPLTFPPEDYTAPRTEDPSDPGVEQETIPGVSGETFPFDPPLDENELPPIPFEP